MTDSFRNTVDRLRCEALGPVAARHFADAQSRHAVLASYAGLDCLLCFLSGDGSASHDKRDAITKALLCELASSKTSVWSTVLVVAYYPMLSTLRRRLVCRELAKEDLDQLVLEAFLETVSSYKTERWPNHAPLRLAQGTRGRVFEALRRELLEWQALDLERNHVRSDSEHVPPGSTCAQPITLSVDAVLRAIEHHASAEGASIVRDTELGTLTLHGIVSCVAEKGHPEHRRIYQRLKRMRTRVKQRLREAIGEGCVST